MPSWEYVAGFFDGEGNICISPAGRWMQVRLRLAQRVSHRKVLDQISLFLEEWGIHCTMHIQRRPQGSNAQDAVILTVATKVDVEYMLGYMLPYLIVKKDDAVNALEFLFQQKERVKVG